MATAFPKEGRRLLQEFDLVAPCDRAFDENGAVDPGSAIMALGDRPHNSAFGSAVSGSSVIILHRGHVQELRVGLRPTRNFRPTYMFSAEPLASSSSG